LKRDAVDFIVLLRTHNTENLNAVNAVLRRASSLAEKPLLVSDKELNTDLEKQTAELQRSVNQTVALANLYSAALDKVIANGFVPSISRHVDIVIQMYKTLCRIIEDDEKAGRATEQRTIEFHAAFQEMIMSLPEKLVRGKMELWNYLLLSAEQDTLPQPPKDPADLKEYVERKTDLRQQLELSAKTLTGYQPDIMQTFWEGLVSGLDKDIQTILLEEQSEQETQEISRQKQQVVRISNIGQLAELLKANPSELMPGVRAAALERLSSLLKNMSGKAQPGDTGALQEIISNYAIPQNIRNQAAELLDELKERSGLTA
jgi:hypothetical protein